MSSSLVSVLATTLFSKISNKSPIKRLEGKGEGHHPEGRDDTTCSLLVPDQSHTPEDSEDNGHQQSAAQQPDHKIVELRLCFGGQAVLKKGEQPAKHKVEDYRGQKNPPLTERAWAQKRPGLLQPGLDLSSGKLKAKDLLVHASGTSQAHSLVKSIPASQRWLDWSSSYQLTVSPV